MKTKSIINTLFSILFCLASVAVFAQNALDRKQSTYQVGSYTPIGNTGAYYEGLHFKYEITPVSVSSDNQSEYNKIQIVFRAFSDGVNTYKYNGKNYNVADLCNYNSHSLNQLSKFIMSISVSGGGTDEFIIENLGAVVIHLNKSYTREELKQVNVTNITLINIYPDDIAVAAVERCLNQHQQEKDEKAKKELDDKIAEGKSEQETSEGSSQNTNNAYRYNNVSATEQKIATIDNAHSEFNNAIDQTFESTRQKISEHQQESEDWWENQKEKAEKENEWKKEADKNRKNEEDNYNLHAEKMRAQITKRIIENPNKYDYIDYFSEDGLALVIVGDTGYRKYGFIDISGTEIIPLKYDYARTFTENLAVVFLGDTNKMKGKYGYIDTTGKEVIPIQYQEAESLSEGLAAVKQDYKWGYIDKNGKTVIPFDYGSANSFSEGLAYVQSSNDGKYGYIDNTGKTVIPFKYNFTQFSSFSEGLAPVTIDGKYGFIDKTGKEVIPIKLEYGNVHYFAEDLAWVILNSKYGFIDKTGKEVIQPKYEEASSFSEGLAVVKLNGKYGFIDKTGNEVIPTTLDYKYVSSFIEGMALVKVNGKYGFIDKTGQEVIPAKYEHTLSSFKNGRAIVKLDGRYFYIDKNGNGIKD